MRPAVVVGVFINHGPGQLLLIRLTENELARTRRLQGDLSIVAGHENATEIGRVAVWDGQIKTCVHQNHLIRARPGVSLLAPGFAADYLNSSSRRRHLLRRGKTTSGLNTITTSDVRDCPLFVSPIGLQRRFSAIIAPTRDTLNTTETGTRTSLELFGSLIARLLGSQEQLGAATDSLRRHVKTAGGVILRRRRRNQ